MIGGLIFVHTYCPSVENAGGKPQSVHSVSCTESGCVGALPADAEVLTVRILYRAGPRLGRWTSMVDVGGARGSADEHRLQAERVSIWTLGAWAVGSTER